MASEFEDWVDRARHSPIEAEIARRGIRLRKSGTEHIGPCPRCGGTDRFSVNPKGVWNCRQCKPDNIAGDIIGLVQWLDGVDFIRAVETINGEPALLVNKVAAANISGLVASVIPPRPAEPQPGPAHRGGNGAAATPHEVAAYAYTDEFGAPLFQVVRYEPKGFRQRRPLPGGGWDWSVKGVRPVPFRLPELVEAVATGRQVFICEGEKDVLTLTALGIVATCNPGGAGKWRDEFNAFFHNADVVVLADHDPQTVNAKTGDGLVHPDGRPRHPGLDHALHIATQLKPVAASVRMIEISELWPACGDKADITNFFEHGGTVEALNSFVASRPPWTPEQTTPTTVTAIPIVQAFPIDGSKLPRRPWLVPGLLMRRQVTVIIAPPGSGKSLLTLQLAMICSANNGPWGNWFPRGAYRTLIVNVEEDQDEMKRRLFGAAVRMNISQDRLTGVYLAQTDSIVIAKIDTRSRAIIATPMLESLVQTILAERIDIVIVDPFAESHFADENSNSELKWCAVLWREVARRTNCAIILVHHTRKYANSPGDPDAGRGAGALTGVARIMATLFTMTAEEAEMTGVSSNERARYIRFDDAKANLSAIIQGAQWFEKIITGIGNPGDGLPEDSVAVLVPWSPPDVIANMSIATANEILDSLRDGMKETGDAFCLSKKGGSARWGGRVIQEALCCDEAAAKKLLALWVKSGVITEVQAPTSTSKGALRGCIRINESFRPGDKL